MKNNKKQFWSVLFAAFIGIMLFSVSALANTLNDAMNGPAVSLNTNISGNLTEDENGKCQYYRIEMPASGNLTMKLTNATNMEKLGYQLFHEDQLKDAISSETFNASNGMNVGTASWELSKGTYYLRIVGNYASREGNYTGPFTLHLAYKSANVNHNETDNTVLTAQQINPGSNIRGHFSLMDQRDYFKINLSSAGTISLKILSNMREFGVAIVDMDYKELTGKTLYWDSASEMGSETQTYDLSQGTYYLRFQGDSWNSSSTSKSNVGAYNVEYKFESAGVNHQEPNDTIQQATAVANKQKINGFFAKDSMVDFYKITVPSTGQYVISATTYVEELGIQLYGENYNKIDNAGYTVYWDSAAKSKTESKVLNLEKGTYYVRVIGNYYSSSNGHYTGKYSIVFGGNMPSSSLLNSAVISAISDQIYNKTELKPYITVKLNGSTLRKDRDYLVSYTNNKYPGKATVTVSGIGAYGGSKSVTFNIKPANQTIKSAKSKSKGKVSFKLKKASKVTGYQIYYSKSYYGKYKKLATITSTKATLGMKSGRTFYVKARAYKKVGSKTIKGNFGPIISVRVK